MLTNGLLLTLTDEEHLVNEVLRLISARDEAVVGSRVGRCLPIAAELDDTRAAHEFHEWLESLEGVDRVDVIYVGMEPAPTPVSPP